MPARAPRVRHAMQLFRGTNGRRGGMRWTYPRFLAESGPNPKPADDMSRAIQNRLGNVALNYWFINQERVKPQRETRTQDVNTLAEIPCNQPAITTLP